MLLEHPGSSCQNPGNFSRYSSGQGERALLTFYSLFLCILFYWSAIIWLTIYLVESQWLLRSCVCFIIGQNNHYYSLILTVIINTQLCTRIFLYFTHLFVWLFVLLFICFCCCFTSLLQWAITLWYGALSWSNSLGLLSAQDHVVETLSYIHISVDTW